MSRVVNTVNLAKFIIAGQKQMYFKWVEWQLENGGEKSVFYEISEWVQMLMKTRLDKETKVQSVVIVINYMFCKLSIKGGYQNQLGLCLLQYILDWVC